MGTIRSYDGTVQRAAALELTAVGEELTGAAGDIGGVGRTALDGAGQFAGELAEGAAVLSLSWAAVVDRAALSSGAVASVTSHSAESAELLDARAAAGLTAGRPR